MSGTTSGSGSALNFNLSDQIAAQQLNPDGSVSTRNVTGSQIVQAVAGALGADVAPGETITTGGDVGLLVNPQIILQPLTIPAASNALLVGPVMVAIGAAITVPVGSVLKVF